MDFYSDLADADVVGDLLVEAASHHQGHHLALARGESLEARPQRSDRLFVLQPRAIPREAQLDRVQQVLIAERLGQELDRSSLYRLDGHRDVAVSGDEDDRNVNVRRRQLSLKIETTSARQPDVEHKASGAVRAPLVQEFGNRSQGLGLRADGSDQAAERLANSWVVIDDDDGRLFCHRLRPPRWRHRSQQDDGPSCVRDILKSSVRRGKRYRRRPWPPTPSRALPPAGITLA